MPPPNVLTSFLAAATVPREGHSSGTLTDAEAILALHPEVCRASIHAAAVLGDQKAVTEFLAQSPGSATLVDPTLGWDPLTCLCFSRYLRLDRNRAAAFERAAAALLDAGADANTGWWETIGDTIPRQILESVIYGAAAIAQQPGLTRLLLERGADPNDEETAYHVVETDDLTVAKILLESGRFNEGSLATLLLRYADWHNYEGMKLALEHGADPNSLTHWRITALQQALRRDNAPASIALLLDCGADATLVSPRLDLSGASIAARRGRADVLRLFEERQIDTKLSDFERILAACALGDDLGIRAALEKEPKLAGDVLREGGVLLAEFAGNGNVEGLHRLLDLGVAVGELYHGDGYWDIAPNSTALHVAAWRGKPEVMRLLLGRGADVNVRDGRNRTPLQLAIRACTDSYWKGRRTVEWIAPLIEAGGSLEGIHRPTGYPEADELLSRYAARWG